MANCFKCGRALTNDEIGLHKKMVNRGAVKFMCLPCLAAYFDCDCERLEEKIRQFKSMGCMLFSSEEEKKDCGSDVHGD